MISSYLIPILVAILGVVMLAITSTMLVVLVIVVGAYLIISGISSAIQLSKLSKDKAYRINLFTRCAVSVLLGCVCIVLAVNGTLNTVINLMLIILGVYASVAAISEIATVLKLKEQGIPVKKNITEIAGTVISAVVLFLLASPLRDAIVRICGVIVLIVAIVLAIATWRNQKAERVEVEVVDDDDSAAEDSDKE